MIGMRLFRAAALLLPAAVSACSLVPKREHRTQTTFLLAGNHPAHEGSETPASGRSAVPVTVLVSRPQARPGFDTPRMAYLPHPGEVRYYAFHEWADTPGRMLGPMAVEALERSGCCGMVIRAPGAVPGDIRLDIEDLALGQEFFSTPSVVRLSFRALLVDLRGRDVVAATRFEAVETAPSEDPQGGAAAAGRAARKALAELSEWVARSVAAHAGRDGSGLPPVNANRPPEPVIR